MKFRINEGKDTQVEQSFYLIPYTTIDERVRATNAGFYSKSNKEKCQRKTDDTIRVGCF